MKIQKSLLIAALLCVPGIASAVPMSWNYSGTCTFGCVGETFSGSLFGDAGGNSFLSTGEVINWQFSLSGGGSASGTGASVGGAGYLVGASGNILAGQMTFGNGLLAVRALTGWNAPAGFEATIGGTGSFAVPEPGTLALLGLGLAGLGLMRRKRAA